MGTTMVKVIFLVVLLTAVLVSVLIIFRPKSKWHDITINHWKDHKALIAIAMAAVIICCIVPMNMSPKWNGEEPEHRDQYEKITESFLQGHLYFDYEAEEKLLELDNPYDLEARRQNDVEYHHDHSFYNGKYYMYFGVVPVVITFLPFRLLTGQSLAAYHATQIYTALFIIGIFYCFFLIAKKRFKNMPISMYILLSSAFAVMCVWNAVSTPAMYCTASTCGLMFMIFGVAFWIKAAWSDISEKKSMVFAVAGSLCGALTFGCRPPIGLGNILILVMIWYYFRNRKAEGKILLKLLLIALPYIIVAASLMWYNYARFGNVFDFGQKYQLTIANVSDLPKILSTPSLVGKVRVIIDYCYTFLKYLFGIATVDRLAESLGVFFMFPILFYIFIGIENESVRSEIQKRKTKGFVLSLIASILIIVMTNVVFSPLIYSRYKMDFYWLLAILAFYLIGTYYQFKKHKRRFCIFICCFALITILTCVVMFVYPYDQNFTSYYILDIYNLLHIKA